MDDSSEKNISLFEKIKMEKSGAFSTERTPSCALDLSKQSYAQRCKQCAGQGIVLSLEGVFTQAALCSCVSACLACFGRCRTLKDGISVSCREPNPSRVVSAVNEAKIPMKYARATLDAFTNYTGNGRDVIQQIRQWLQSFNPRGTRGLLLSGPVGVGKTFILAAIAKYLAMRGYSVRFVDFFQLLSELKNAYTQDQSDESVLAPLVSCDVLVIDELGKGRSTDWELTILDHLIMGRYNQNKVVVASTNYLCKQGTTPQKATSQFNIDLELSKDQRSGASQFANDEFGPLETRVGKRIFSRLCEMVDFVEVSGHDYRKMVRSEQNKPITQ